MFHEKIQREKTARFRDAVSAHGIPWCVAGVPGPAWARRVLGEGGTTAELWEVLKPILFLDRDDPAGAWKDKAQLLLERSEKLNSLKIDTLWFHGGGTDLRVGILPASLWNGGADVTGGHVTLPNIPTEEVFTTPDRLRCDGTVRVTRPVEVRGTLVIGAVLTFRNGELTDFTAQDGLEALKGYVETDPGASRLGEVALVAEDSPIAASGLNFDSVLYDENASCHIALGSGYPGCLSNGDRLRSDKDKLDAGCNVSLVHLDFMIGSPSVSVTGIDRFGRETLIIRDGRFTV
jgi:aminopeptidase